MCVCFEVKGKRHLLKVIPGINNKNGSQHVEVCVVLGLAAQGFGPLEMGRAPFPVQPQPSEPPLACPAMAGLLPPPHFCFLWGFTPGLAVFLGLHEQVPFYLHELCRALLGFLSSAISIGLSHTSLRVLS